MIKKQVDDLSRQIKYIQSKQSKYTTYTTLSDIGSGINFKRKGLQTLLSEKLLLPTEIDFPDLALNSLTVLLQKPAVQSPYLMMTETKVLNIKIRIYKLLRNRSRSKNFFNMLW